MIGTITHILAKAGYKAMNGPLADERRRLAGAVPPAAYVSYDPRMLAGAGWYGYRIALKGGDRSMLERARYMLEQQYVIRDSYEYYADGIYTFGVLLRQRVPHYGIGGGSAPAPEPDALNFYMPDGGTITLTRNGSPTVVELEYSIDGGATWQVWEEAGNVRSITLAAGQKMYMRNTSETSTGFSTNGNYYQFALSQITYAGGKIDSLLCKNADDAILQSVCFYRLFLNQNNLLSMPLFSEKTSVYGFREMFRGCNGLVETTLLKATTLNVGAYMGMFQSCQNLSKVRTLMTDISGTSSTTSWLLGVSNTGDFYCPADLTIPTGSNGIPASWTRHDI